jgi:hypothetical protein
MARHDPPRCRPNPPGAGTSITPPSPRSFGPSGEVRTADNTEQISATTSTNEGRTKVSDQERIAQLETAVKKLEAALRETRDKLNAALQVTGSGNKTGMLGPMESLGLVE